MKKIRIPAVTCILLLFPSCLILEGRAARDQYIAENKEEEIRHAILVLDNVDVVKGAETRRIQENAEYILRLLFEKRRSQAELSSAELHVRVRLKEESFVKDFKAVNTVGAEFILFEKDSSLPLALLFESEDTENTLTSYAYLHGLLTKALGKLR